MSKKSGLFWGLVAQSQKMFGIHDYRGDFKANEAEINVAKNHPKGKRHRTFGKEITSFGSKPSYYKDKVLYIDKGDIIYVSVGHSYWRTRALAEANR